MILRLFSLTVLLIIAIDANAQSFYDNEWYNSSELEQAQTILLDSIIKYQKGNPVSKFIYTKSDNGSLSIYTQCHWSPETNNWENNNNEEHIYDDNGKETLFISYEWDEESKSIKKRKIEYAYDKNGNRTLRLYFGWDAKTNSWVYSNKEESSYDDNGNQTLLAWYSWNSMTNSWVGNEPKYEHSYDANGRETYHGSFNWNSETNSWIYNRKTEINYIGNQTISVSYDWNIKTNSWKNDSKTEYTKNGNQTIEIDYKWDSGTNSWVNYEKKEYTYDSNNNITLELNYSWVTEANYWLYRSKKEYAYNTNGSLILEVNSGMFNSYSIKNGQIINLKQHIGHQQKYEYDDNGFKTLSIEYEWDTKTNSLVITTGHKEEHNYDDFINETLYYDWDKGTNSWVIFDGHKSEYAYDTDGNLVLSISYYWNTKTSSWLNNSKTAYSYNAYGEKTLQMCYNWNVKTNSWDSSSKIEYDRNGNKSIEVANYWDVETNTWKYRNKSEYFYNQNGEKSFEMIYNWDDKTNSWENGLFLYFYNSIMTYDTDLKDFNYNPYNINYTSLGNNRFKIQINVVDSYNYYIDDNNKQDITSDDNIIYTIELYFTAITVGNITTVINDENTSEVNIYTIDGNTIIIENASKEIIVYDAMGRLVYRNATNCIRSELHINNIGVYIVKVGKVAKRVMIND